MSDSIRNSLNRLYLSAQKLEAAVEAKRAENAKNRLNAPQTDLFASPVAQGAAGASPVNVRVLASRLDTAINKVEQILKEGRG